MHPEDFFMTSYFLSVFLFTVIVTRIFLYFHPTPSPTILGFRTHHYLYGIIGIIAGLFFHSLTIYAIGLGLLVDELTFILMRGTTHADNYSKTSLIGTAICTVLVIIFHRYFLIIFTHNL